MIVVDGEKADLTPDSCVPVKTFRSLDMEALDDGSVTLPRNIDWKDNDKVMAALAFTSGK